MVQVSGYYAGQLMKGEEGRRALVHFCMDAARESKVPVVVYS